MSKILHLQASPRGERSKSIAVATAFLDVYRDGHPDDDVETLDLFETELIAFDGLALRGKYAILHGQEHTDEEAAAWRTVEALADHFKSADKYVLAVPMWNFGIPYRLKHYIDILVQPTLTFNYTPEEGYTGLVTGRRAFVAYARGGEYPEGTEAESFDFQKKHLDTILGFIGITDVQSVVVQPTLMGGPDVAQEKLDAAIEQATQIAADF
ncbi:MAG: FMN-dependent NADH-azoreductase [Planctomycetota bacterium]